jgi:hypothetical protein
MKRIRKSVAENFDALMTLAAMEQISFVVQLTA